VDSLTANRSLSLDELSKKAARLHSHGLHGEALEVRVYATRRYSNLKAAWLGLLDAPNADPSMKEEAQHQLERIERMIYG
jgi:hypothetical protein